MRTTRASVIIIEIDSIRPTVGCGRALLMEQHHLNDLACYRIHALGNFSPRWLDMLSGDWSIADQSATQPDATILVGQVADQAALMGVLNHLYDIGLSLLSVECLHD